MVASYKNLDPSLWCLFDTFTWSAVVKTYQMWFKEGQLVTGDRVLGAQGSLMHMGSEGYPCCPIPQKSNWSTNFWKKLMQILIERYQNTQCISAYCVWGFVEWPECPYWPLSTTESTTGKSEPDHRAMEEGGLDWWITFSFTCGLSQYAFLY